MKSNMAPFVVTVPIMGKAARLWLSDGQRGKVLASVNHATYLLTEAGELVWLATPESPKHRRCIQCPPPLPRLAVDSTFTIRARLIVLESGTELKLGAAQVWEAPALPVNEVIDFGILPFKLFAVVASFLARETPAGFGAFIRPVLQIAEKQASTSGFQPEDIFSKTAWPVVEKIARACLSHDLPTVLEQADALIGLGEGLTPAGDDFLGGLFFTRYLLSCSYSQYHYLKLGDLSKWIDANQPRTNRISYTLLKDNIYGHALEPLNRLGLALLTNQPVEIAGSAASDLIKVGHSTGWSLLTGFLVGMLPVFPKHYI